MKNFILTTFCVLFITTIRLIAQPTTAPTTPPARNASDVVALFSEAYTEVAGTDWFPNWGQSTVVANQTIAGNIVKSYTNLNYQGVQFGSAVNASSMTNLHLDIWTPNCTAFDVFLINTSPATVEQKVTLTPTLSGWNSFDIALSQYTAIALNNIGQFKLVGTPFGSSTVYLDNIYFWKPANVPTITGFTVPAKVVGDAPFSLTAPTSNSSGAFSYTSSNTAVATVSGSMVTIVGLGTSTITANQAAAGGFSAGSTTATLVVTSPGPSTAAATPTKTAANVSSLFSNAYTNLGVDTWSASWDVADVADVQIAGNDAKKYTNLTYAGIEFTGANMINATSRTHFHLDVWTADAATFNVKLVDFGANGAYAGGDDSEHELSFTPTLSGWYGIDVPLSNFTGLAAKAHLAQMIIVAPGGGKTVWLDNVYFYNVPTIPVELTFVKAKAVNNTSVLTWQTASERDNQGFTVEHSSNGVNYTAIGQVKGNGTTATVHDYSFIDNTPSVGSNYYRLRQTDMNGKETLSPVVSVVFGKSGLIVKNTVAHDALDVLVSDAAPVTVNIFNVSGQQVYSHKIQGAQSINVSSFATGLYILHTSTGEVSRFIKQ